MHNEDIEAAQMEEHEYSSDEDYPVPSEWINPGFGNPMLADWKEQECEYRENELVQEAKYSSSGDVKDAVKRWAISLGKEFRVARSNSSVYDVVCVKEGCPWRVHAYKGTFKSYWKVSFVQEHTCVLEGVQNVHRNITTDFIAKEKYMGW